MTVTPISPSAASLRVAIVSAAEAELIATVAAAQDPAAEVADAKAASPPDPVKQAVDAALASAAGRQASLAPLFADLSQALARPGLPGALKAAIGQILAFQLPSNGPFTAETIRQAVAQSGLFLEANLAQAAPGADGPRDLRAALLTLLQALAGPAEDVPPPPQRTAPPARGAALTAQAPAPPTLPADADAAAIIRHLRPQVEQAVARQTLHQLASLPDGNTTTAWMFELPIATPQGTAIAQFEVDRDAPEAGAADAAETWRVRFSVDIEPLGPVHVHLGLKAGRAAATVWCECEGGLDLLRSQGAELVRALPGDVVFRLGAPRQPIPARGRFVDQAS